MQELMDFIYSKLSAVSNTCYKSIERDEEGNAIINDIVIVYSIPNIYSSNNIRNDCSLVIDIWGKQEQLLEMESKIKLIDDILSNEVYRSYTLHFLISKKPLWILNLDDEDKNIVRKQLNFNIRFYN